MIHHYVKTSLTLFVLLFFSLALNAQLIVPFNSIYQTNQRGGIVFLSNSALGCSANPSAATGSCQVASQETPVLGTTRNDDFLASYIDIDADASTFMSSSEQLNLPSCSRITKAILFWAASGNSVTAFNQIKLKVNNGLYQTVTATTSTVNTIGINSYHCYADVTSLLSLSGINDLITVANISSSMIGQANAFGSWNLAVVYKNDAMNMRQITVMNGLAHLSTLTPTVNVPLSGFLTPTIGAVSFEIGVYAHDGDRGIVGDNVLFNGNTLFFPLTDLTTNPMGDGMNSTVSYNGLSTTLRNPLLYNTMGTDADVYQPLNLLNGFLANSATTATIQLATTVDNYLVQTLASSIDSYEPDLRATLRSADINGGTLNPGDVVRYTIRGANFGTDISTGTFITDTLDANVNYIANSTSVTFGPNSGSKTDILSDDQVDYDATQHILKIRIGTGANATTGGSLNGSLTGADSTVVTYSVAVTQSCLRLSCNNILKARAYISGTGATFTSHTFTNASTPGTSDSFSCSITGITSAVVTTTACGTPTATSTSPVCTGGSILLNATPDPDAAYVWTGPLSYTAGIRNPIISNVTTAAAGIYSVTLTIPNTTCSANAITSVTVISCPPTAVNDFTNTTANVPVFGDASANDINGIPNGTYTILTQPANGTVTLNSSTGQYTFTPANGFTGITTATYQLCNGNPVVCSTATITVNVYATLVVNPDLIITAPSVSVTGNVSANDNSTLTGVNYSLTYTPILASTGTLLVNAIGQYTFIPNPAFTGSAQTTYTVCNTTVNPSQCSSTTITILVKPNPAPVNDGIATVINTSVTGNAAANDNGVATGTFAITNQPANGTITIDPATGNYTFTPANNFTGVTTATYNLCNGAPNSCSAAVISATVYPLLVAVNDAVNTTPATATTGTLLANDIGITPSASYSVTIVQTPLLTGTFIINAATGQYTFTPNVLFTGTAQTTYNVCNTSVNPTQCSTATITINVGNQPIAVNDATTTLINTPVSGNAGANDSGTFGGTFTYGTITAGTGTFLGNPLTGQYSYIPASGFTGTASVNYTLCNLVSPVCSTASITFTVYPTLIANGDVIATLPSVTSNGNLLTNDTGITQGAVYSVSSSNIAASTGTLTVDPATGNYTFIPNPSFTGNAQTSYTVCNMSVTPQQCSSASISILVGNFVTAVNDQTLTLMGVPVSGNVSLNDSNTSGGTFTFNGPSPVTGNLVGNPATGDYTFTPYPGFSGITYASYTVCTVLSAPCSTALITFTVYPTLEAKPDHIVTFMNTPTTGNLKINDAGIFPNGSYSVTASSPAPAIGTLTVDASGNYTFVPALGFIGSGTTTYTLTQYNGATVLQSSSTTITLTVKPAPSPLGIAKSISHVAYNNNGTFYLTYKVVVKNYSNQALSSASVLDNLDLTFPQPATYTVTGPPALITASGSQLIMNASYSGALNSSLTSTNSTLPPGRTDTIVFTVQVDPHNIQHIYNNSASVFAFTGANSIKDTSANGLDPDPDSDGDPGNNQSVTPFNVSLVHIGLAKQVSRSESDGNGCYNTTFKFTVKNYGPSTIYNIQLIDNLNRTFGNVNYSIPSPPVSTNGYLAPYNLFNGSSNDNLLSNISHLDAGKTDTILLRVKYCSGASVSFSNTATTYGNSVEGGGFIGYDISTNGLDPDPNGNGNPSDPGEDLVTGFTSGDNFSIPAGFSPNNGDNINNTFEIKGIDDYKNLELTILNRWGTTVYNKKHYDNSWDGKCTEGVQFGGNDLPEGTYYYIVDLGNGQKPLKGFVYLNRAVR